MVKKLDGFDLQGDGGGGENIEGIDDDTLDFLRSLFVNNDDESNDIVRQTNQIIRETPKISNEETLPTKDNSSTMNTAQGFRSPQNEHQTPSKHHVQLLSHQPQFHPINQNHHQQVLQSQHATQFSQNHQCGPSSHMPEIAHAAQSPTIPQHMVYLHSMPTSPPKYCDECGAPYRRETSKFCSECGTKRFFPGSSMP